jgi:hypothetical protein
VGGFVFVVFTVVRAVVRTIDSPKNGLCYTLRMRQITLVKTAIQVH